MHACLIRGSSRYGQVAQLVEQRTENPRVGGSIPSLATKKSFIFLIVTSRAVFAGSVALTGDIVQFGRSRDAQMTKPIVRDLIYRRRRFDAEVIELCVRWYITYRLSYRDLVAMMAEWGVTVSRPAGENNASNRRSGVWAARILGTGSLRILCTVCDAN